MSHFLLFFQRAHFHPGSLAQHACLGGCQLGLEQGGCLQLWPWAGSCRAPLGDSWLPHGLPSVAWKMLNFQLWLGFASFPSTFFIFTLRFQHFGCIVQEGFLHACPADGLFLWAFKAQCMGTCRHYFFNSFCPILSPLYSESTCSLPLSHSFLRLNILLTFLLGSLHTE